MQRLLKTTAAAGLVLAAALVLRCKGAKEGAPIPLDGVAEDAKAQLSTDRRPLNLPNGLARNVTQAWDAGPLEAERSQEEQAAQAECWARCGAPCVGEEQACHSAKLLVLRLILQAVAEFRE